MSSNPTGQHGGMNDRQQLAEQWPLFGLVVRTPLLELRYPTDVEVATLAAGSGDIHEPDAMPFTGTWSLLPDGDRERSILQYHWRCRGVWAPDAWELALVVVVDGEVVGTQGVLAQAWQTRRTVETGSWLQRPHQGRGLGTEMRRAVLHLAFAGLGAVRAETEAFDWNLRSQQVTKRLGYQANGDRIIQGQEPGAPARRAVAYALERDQWEEHRPDHVEIIGLEPCRVLFGMQS